MHENDAALLARRLDHSKPAGEQEPWRCVAIGSVGRMLALQVAVTDRHEMEAGVFAFSAMNEKQAIRYRLEVQNSRLLYAVRSPSGATAEGAKRPRRARAVARGVGPTRWVLGPTFGPTSRFLTRVRVSICATWSHLWSRKRAPNENDV